MRGKVSEQLGSELLIAAPKRLPSRRRSTNCAKNWTIRHGSSSARLRATRSDATARRRQLAERIRRRDLPVDRAAADEVRRAGWARQ